MHRRLTIERRAVLTNTARCSIVEPRVFGAFQKPIFHVPWVLCGIKKVLNFNAPDAAIAAQKSLAMSGYLLQKSMLSQVTFNSPKTSLSADTPVRSLGESPFWKTKSPSIAFF